MMLDVCLEVSGSYAHLVGVDVVHAILPARHRARRLASRAVRDVAAHHGPDRSDGLDGFEARLSAAIDRLPLLLAHILWLVDVCGCTYETAAAELGRSPVEVERLVAEARHQLRHDLVSGPRRSSEESTNRSRPGLPPPVH